MTLNITHYYPISTYLITLSDWIDTDPMKENRIKAS